MTFLIRHISLTADGREIVREARVDADTLGVGRSAENAIALPDLAVAPDHAKIVRRDDRRISVTSTRALGFVADGRSVERAEIDAARGAELGFGGHRITISRNAAGEIVLSVRRVEEISGEERDEARAFSLRGKLPGRRMTSWLLVIGVLIGFLAVPIWGHFAKARGERSIYAEADSSWSSGPLSQAHHSLEKNCESCHVQAFVSVRDETCRTCHKDAHDHADPKRLTMARTEPTAWGRFMQSVAKTFGKPEPGACVDCHSEHEGAGPMQETRQAFCTDCHTGLSKRLADTKLPDAGDFGTAHPEFRPSYLSGGDAKPIRASLAAAPDEANGLKFPHDLHLNRTGGVARMAQTLKARAGYGDALECKDCHVPTADGVRFLPMSFEQNCQACHSLAFEKIGGTVRTLRHGDIAQMSADLRAYYRSTPAARPAELGGQARRRPGQYAQGQVYGAYFGSASQRAGLGEGAIRAVFSPGGACGECHIVLPPSGGQDWRVMPVHQPARYMLHGWFDHAAHKTESCASCHKADQSGSAADLILPGIETCRTCHGGEASAAKVPSGCAMCHSYHIAEGAPWTPARTVARRTRGN